MPTMTCQKCSQPCQGPYVYHNLATDQLWCENCAKQTQEAQRTLRVCPTCGEPFVRRGVESMTCVGYFSPEGHDHDDNCLRRIYTCAEGHQTTVSLRRRCPAPGCDWTGKEICRCHPGPKVDEWPKIEVRFGKVTMPAVKAPWPKLEWSDDCPACGEKHMLRDCPNPVIGVIDMKPAIEALNDLGKPKDKS